MFEFDYFLSKFIIILGLEKYSGKILKFFNFEKFVLTILFAVIFFITVIFLFSFILNKRKEIKKNFFLFLKNQFFFIKKIISTKLILLLIIPTILSLYFAYTLPATYDETFTYINFIDRGIFVSASFYPAPNNHILYSEIASSLKYLIKFHSLIPYRLLSVLFFFLSILVFIKIIFILENKFNYSNLFIIALAPLTFIALYQSALARGYSLQLFLTLVNVFISIKIIKNQNNLNWIFFAIVSSLAFYTVPTYLYAHLIISLYILFNLKEKILIIIKYNFLILLICFYLYFPIILFNDFNSKLISKINLVDNLFYTNEILKNITNDFLGLNFNLTILFVTLSLFISFFTKKSKKYILLFLIFFGQFLLHFFHQDIAPLRVFVLNYFLFYYLIFFSISDRINKISKKILLCFCIMLQFILAFAIHNKLPYEKYSIYAELYSTKILKNNGKYLLCSNLFDPLLIFYIKKYNFQNIVVHLTKEKNCSFKKNNDYDWVVIDKKRDVTNKVEVTFESSIWNFYKMNN